MLTGEHDRTAHHRRVGHHVMTRHGGASTIRRGERRQDLHCGRLAGAVGPEQRNDLAAAHVEGDVAQRRNRTE